MSSVWDTRAKGLYVDDSHGVITPEELTGMDFLIAKTGNSFTAQIQSAYDCDPRIPFIAFYENNPEPYLDMGCDKTKWPIADNDPQIAYIDNMLGYNKTTKKISRAVNGFMLSFAKIWHQGTKAFTTEWITKHGQHMYDMINDRYRLPMYLYIDSNPWAVWKDDINGIEMLNAIVKYQISTVSITKVLDGIVPATGQVIKLPADSEHWYFWLYGIASKGLRLLYNGNKTALYRELNFSSGETPTSGSSINTETGEVSGADIEYLKTTVNKNNLLLDEILIKLNVLSKHFTDI